MTEPQIISIVSGKGGVGKTMLSVAIANELARSKKTLLFDLDFFNRGLTGLFASSKVKSLPKPIKPPKFFGDSEADWSVGEVERNLFMIFYDDLDKSQSDVLVIRDIASLAGDLSAFLHGLASTLECEFVVLDCHGGPDNTSFAACTVASRTVVVSEPDRITLHGTLNFLRILKRQAGNKPLDIRLVFNKVVTAFTSMFLFNFYAQYLRKEFGGRDLLAIYPLEVYLTKAFEKIPYLTTVYPMSQLAIKTRLVLFELFHAEGPAVLPPQIAGMTAVERFQSKYYLGRRPKLLDLEFVLKAVAVYAAVVFGLPSLMDHLPSSHFGSAEIFIRDNIQQNYFLQSDGMAAALIWIMVVILLNWVTELDTFMTYAFRTRAFIASVVDALVLAAIWCFVAIFLGAMLNAAMVHPGRIEESVRPFRSGFSLSVAAVPVIILALYMRRGIRNIKFDGRYAEGIFRIVLPVAFSLLTLARAMSDF